MTRTPFWEPRTLTDPDADVSSGELHVGGRIHEDVHGPRQVGMRPTWVAHPSVPPSRQVAVPAMPEAVARTLLDVLDIVDARCSDG